MPHHWYIFDMNPSLPRVSQPNYRRQVYVGTDRPMAVWQFDHASSDVLHGHDYLELQWIVGGGADHRDALGVRRVRRGDMLIIRPGTVHAYARTRQLDVYVLCLAPELLSQVLQGVIDEPRLHTLLRSGAARGDSIRPHTLHIGPAELKKCEQSLARLKVLNTSPWLNTRIEQVGHLLLLLDVLVQVADNERVAGGSDHAGTCGFVHPAVTHVAGLLESDPSEAWTLGALAESACVSEAYLSRLFKKQIGVGPIHYLNRLRVERAAGLLHTDRSIQQIATDVGWPEPSHFSRRFREYMGISATGYRQQFRSSSR